MKNKKFFGIPGLILLGLVVSAGLASAFGFGFGKHANPENSEEVLSAIRANDFEAWKQAKNSQLTQERFSETVKRQNARTELFEARESMRKALEEKDYDAWKAIAGSISEKNAGISVLSQEDFNKLSELYQARMNGDCESAKELKEGLQGWTGGGMGKRLMKGDNQGFFQRSK